MYSTLPHALPAINEWKNDSQAHRSLAVSGVQILCSRRQAKQAS